VRWQRLVAAGDRASFMCTSVRLSACASTRHSGLLRSGSVSKEAIRNRVLRDSVISVDVLSIRRDY
jgi:hypothetical protein